jgi:tetratricopeptide (TPR) repeat protein/ribosomal protein S27E
MAALQSGNLDAAEEALREALRLHGTVPGPHSSGVADDLAGLGAVAERRGRLGEAQALYHQELSAVEEGLGLTHPRALDAHRRLAWVCRKSGALDRAEHHYRWVIRWAQVSHGTRHRQVQEDRMFLGVVLCSGGRFEEAWVVLKEIWDLDPHALDKALPPSKAEAFRGVANMLREEKRTAEARSVLWHAFESLDRDPEATDAQRVVCMEPLVGLLVEEGRVREALPLLRRALAWAVRQLGYDHEQAVARRRRVRAAEAFLREEPDALKVECVFCGVEGSPPLAELEDVDTGEYECSACGGVLHQPSLCTQREQELIPSPSEYVHRGGQWFRSRGLPFPFYIRVQCKKCGHEATHYTRRGETGPGSTCPKCGHADEAQPTPETPAAGRPYWEAWGTFRGPLSSWSITCDGCGFEDHGDFHDRPESSCPRCGYGGSGRQD